jgi:hypothetical protein
MKLKLVDTEEPHGKLTSAWVQDQGSFGQLITQIGSSDYLERGRAERALTAAGYQALNPLLDAISMEQQRRKRKQRVLLPVTAITFVVVAAALAASGIVGGAGFPLIVISTLAFFILYNALTRASYRHKAMLRVLASINDTRVVGKFAEALDMVSSDDYAASRLARNALVRLLPRLQASDADYLTPGQRESLCRGLRSGDRDLVLAILKALGQVGDAEAIPHVERVRSNDAVVQRETQQCLELLSARVKSQQTRDTLLRASSEQIAPTEHLLHPSEEPVPHAEQLLRASETDSEQA